MLSEGVKEADFKKAYY
jgi:hypothetical protein